MPIAPSDVTSDAQLIRRFLDGEERAFRQLYERHTPQLKMTLLRLVGLRSADIDDVVQDSWVAACRGMHGFQGTAKFSTWLTSIGIRATLAHLARHREPQDDLDLVNVPADDASPDAGVDVERLLRLLPEQQRMVVVLHDIEGFTHEEIGFQLDIAPGTSKATLSRARAALRMALSQGVSNAS
jgi:RNA polymerase sigma-70 factor (ECF subfamily)